MKGIEADREQSLSETPVHVEAEVRRRAYELYEERGRLDGFEVEDWLKAESEIINRLINQPQLDHSKLDNSKIESSKLDQAKLDRSSIDRTTTDRADLDRSNPDRPKFDRPKGDKAA